MSHNITATDSMFTVREPAWHGLGTVLPDYPTRVEAQKLAHNWEPVTSPLYRKEITVSDDGEISEQFVEATTHHEITRSDNHGFLGVTTSTTSVVTNNEMYDIAEAVQGGVPAVQHGARRPAMGGAAAAGPAVPVVVTVHDDDDWVWFAEQPDDDDGWPRSAGCLLVVVVCLLLWLLVIAGAVALYPS